MQITELGINEIIPYHNNPRHNQETVKTLKISIQEFGFQIPILIDTKNVIVAGHTRWKAAQELGMETLPVIVATNLTPVQIKAFRIMDNKVSEQSEWDYKKLLKEIDDLESLNCDMDIVGFDLLDIEKIRLDFSDLEEAPTNSPTKLANSGEPKEFDPEKRDELEEKTEIAPEPEKSNAVIQYNIIFNDDDEQKIWFGFLRNLKTKYEDVPTISERLVKYIQEEL